MREEYNAKKSDLDYSYDELMDRIDAYVSAPSLIDPPFMTTGSTLIADRATVEQPKPKPTPKSKPIPKPKLSSSSQETAQVPTETVV